MAPKKGAGTGGAGAAGAGGATALPGLQKAVLKVYSESGSREIKCMFNPSQYRISESTEYANKRELAKDEVSPQYVGGINSTLSLALYYDTTDNMGQTGVGDGKKSVMSYVSDLDVLLQVEGDLHKPPEVEFIWGDFSYRGVVSALNKEFTYFETDGSPLRVKMDLTIRRVPGVSSAQKDPPNSPDRTKYRRVQAGMSLWRMAWDEYGDCERWKDIASCNGLMNPLDVSPGQMLKLPALKKI